MTGNILQAEKLRSVTEAAQPEVLARALNCEQSIFAFMQAIARRQPGRRLALDVGAGSGGSSQPYIQLEWQVISLDIDLPRLRLGLEDGWIQPGRAVVADGRHLPFGDGAFDLVSSRWFLHESPEQEAFLREMRRVVQDSGVIIAVDFAAPSPASQVFLNRYVLPNEHARTYSEFAGPWAEAGLAIETIEWHACRIKSSETARKAACGPNGHISTEAKNELRMTCDDSELFLDVPIAFVIARKTAFQTVPVYQVTAQPVFVSGRGGVICQLSKK